MRDPRTRAEWQEAVNLAATFSALADCQMYGLLTGPEVNVRRCDDLLERGRARGFVPTVDVKDEIVKLAGGAS